MTMTRNVLLMILDGWGIGDGSKSDAIRAGHPVFIEELTRSNPHAALRDRKSTRLNSSHAT